MCDIELQNLVVIFLASDVEDVTTTATSLDFSNSSLSDTISIPIEDDQILESTGAIMVTLEQGVGEVKAYTLGSPASATATIVDDDAPILSISAGPQVVEGVDTNATFIVTASKSPDAVVTVGYSFDRKFSSDTTNKAGSSTVELDFRANTTPILGQASGPKTVVEFSLPLNIDPANITLDKFANGEFEVTLAADSSSSIKYAVAIAPNNSAVVAVADNDLPELSIAAGPDVTEGINANATFQVTATTSPNIRLPIKYSFDREFSSDTANKTGSAVDGTLDFTGGKTVATLTLPLNPGGGTLDSFIKGGFNVTLDPVSGISGSYSVATTPNNEATVVVIDDDAPVLSISAGSQVVEGRDTHATFNVTATNSPNAIIAVSYSFNRGFSSDTENTVGSDSVNLDFTNNGTDASFTLPLNPGNVALGVFINGAFEVTLTPDSGPTLEYLVAETPDNTATVSVIDNDIPFLSIAPKVTEVSEPGPAVFTLTAVGITTNSKTLKVRYLPVEVDGGNFLSSVTEVTEDITFTNDGGSYTEDISITLAEDSDPEATGEIEVVLNSPAANTPIDQSYNVGSPNRAKMTIYDNDVPELSITDAVSSVTEGQNSIARFPVTASYGVNKKINVRYFVSQPGTGYNYIVGNSLKTAELDFTSGTTVNLQLDIENDQRDEIDGIVRVTLYPDLDVDFGDDGNPVVDPDGNTTPKEITYTVTSVADDKYGEVTVRDNDLVPQITFVTPTDSDGNNTVYTAAENTGYVEFRVTATRNLGRGFVVRYDPSEVNSGDFLNGSSTLSENQEDIATYSLDFIWTSNNFYTANLRVPIHNDTAGEATGQIEVVLLDGDSTTDNYTVATAGGESRTQRATIWDDDTPEISVSSANPVVEATGAQIEFPVTALISPNKPINIYYTLSESDIDSPDTPDTRPSGDFIDDAIEVTGNMQSVDFSDDATSGTLVIPIVPDTDIEKDTLVTITLEADQSAEVKYTIPTPAPSATAKVIDADSLPTVTIGTTYNNVLPDSSLLFTVTVNPAPEVSLTIPVSAGVQTTRDPAEFD